jgi:hypothetical protein
MSRHARIGYLMGVLTLGLALGEAEAQYALDANLSVHGTRNPRQAPLAVGREIYSINRATGTMVYNRASAFNDSTYSIHQRSAFTLFDSPETSGVFSAADLGRMPIPEAAPPTQITSPSSPPVVRQTPAPGRVAVSPVNQFVPPVSRGPVTRPPTPQPSRPPSALGGPAYSIANRPLRSPGDEVSRVRTYSVFGD